MQSDQSKLKPGGRMVEKPLTTSVGANKEKGKVVVEYSLTLNHLLIPPDEAVRMAYHMILAARMIDPTLPWPDDEHPPAPSANAN